ncbi:SMI1/KNR4 family protein [Streptomyces geranii]|uniref:hypothetical protein n=1 Tax=Streptomyces geranii TaxID=2058923 RepID=UPI000D022B3E|nr:hypothetical protein [Streptomyces geranii]
MSDYLESLLGDRERFRPAAPESWNAIEDWLGKTLPVDYKKFVDGYGDAIFWSHLFVPHPAGGDPLLKFMQEERRYLHDSYAEVLDIPDAVRESWEYVVPWAYHDWNGDVCLLVPGVDDDQWNVAVAFRQCPGFLWVEGGVSEFLRIIVREKKFPRGWPAGDVRWQSMPDSPLV